MRNVAERRIFELIENHGRRFVSRRTSSCPVYKCIYTYSVTIMNVRNERFGPWKIDTDARLRIHVGIGTSAARVCHFEDIYSSHSARENN